jgi:hypothetical protein
MPFNALSYINHESFQPKSRGLMKRRVSSLSLFSTEVKCLNEDSSFFIKSRDSGWKETLVEKFRQSHVNRRYNGLVKGRIDFAGALINFGFFQHKLRDLMKKPVFALSLFFN